MTIENVEINVYVFDLREEQFNGIKGQAHSVRRVQKVTHCAEDYTTSWKGVGGWASCETGFRASLRCLKKSGFSCLRNVKNSFFRERICSTKSSKEVIRARIDFSSFSPVSALKSCFAFARSWVIY